MKEHGVKAYGKCKFVVTADSTSTICRLHRICIVLRLRVGACDPNTICKSGLVIDVLKMIWSRRRPESGRLFHSDSSNQYCSRDFITHWLNMACTAQYAEKEKLG